MGGQLKETETTDTAQSEAVTKQDIKRGQTKPSSLSAAPDFTCTQCIILDSRLGRIRYVSMDGWEPSHVP